MTAVLYLIMRNDIASMNPGKLAAQASHGSNAFVHHFHAYSQEQNMKPATDKHYAQFVINTFGFNEWENATPQGFGTVLVLEAKMHEIYAASQSMGAHGYVSGIIHDPTYPILDGEVVHHIPLDTGAYVFVPNKEKDFVASSFLRNFKLYR
jgi:peptidyl-tRNA hydrolase